MRTLSLLLSVFLFSLFPVQPQAQIYKTYSNARFAYSISYPSNLLTPQGEAENGDGQKFLSSDGHAELIVYGSNNALNQTLKSLYDETRAVKDLNFKVTYEVLKPAWFVVSGIDNGNVFYQKTILRQDVFKTFRMEYDDSEKQKWDPIAARIAGSFKG